MSPHCLQTLIRSTTLLTIVALSAAMNAYAGSCARYDMLLACTTADNKQLELCITDANEVIYEFGSNLNNPEIMVSRSVGEVTYRPANGAGLDEIYLLEVPSDFEGETYVAYVSYEKNLENPAESTVSAGVEEYMHRERQGHIECEPDYLYSNLENYDVIATGEWENSNGSITDEELERLEAEIEVMGAELDALLEDLDS